MWTLRQIIFIASRPNPHYKSKFPTNLYAAILNFLRWSCGVHLERALKTNILLLSLSFQQVHSRRWWGMAAFRHRGAETTHWNASMRPFLGTDHPYELLVFFTIILQARFLMQIWNLASILFWTSQLLFCGNFKVSASRFAWAQRQSISAHHEEASLLLSRQNLHKYRHYLSINKFYLCTVNSSYSCKFINRLLSQN